MPLFDLAHAMSSERRVYHVSPWRQFGVWLIFAPIILFCVVFLLFFSKHTDDPNALWFYIFAFSAVALVVTLLVRRARLTLTADGVRLKQTGYRLEMDWSHVTGMRLERGSEAFITTDPMTGKGAERLAKMRTFGIGAPLYNAEQQALLAEQHLIPIDAFAWHLRHGKLRDDIARFAPHLKQALNALDHLDAPDQRSGIRDIWKILVITLPFIIGAIALAESPKAIQDRIIGVAGLVLLPLLTIRTAYSAWTSFRTRAWIMAAFFFILTLIFFLFSVFIWIDFRETAALGGNGD